MAWASALELGSPLPPGCPSPKSCQVSFLDQDTEAPGLLSRTPAIPKDATRGQPPDPGVDPVACLPLRHQGNQDPANPVLRGWDGLLGKGASLSWSQLGAREVVPKGCARFLLLPPVLALDMEARPRGPWVLAWVRKLIVKPERSRSEIHSAQHTCLGAGLGQVGRR